MTSERQQRAVERIVEDEGLTGDLTDDQARPLIDWASARVAQVAGDPAQSDADVAAWVTAVRQAVLHVASTASDEYDPQRLLALAEQALAQSGVVQPVPPPTTETPPDTTAVEPQSPSDTTAAEPQSQSDTTAAEPQSSPTEPASVSPPASIVPTASPPFWQRIKRWQGGWWRKHRKG